jgi:hypothetical protein
MSKRIRGQFILTKDHFKYLKERFTDEEIDERIYKDLVCKAVQQEFSLEELKEIFHLEKEIEGDPISQGDIYSIEYNTKGE